MKAGRLDGSPAAVVALSALLVGLSLLLQIDIDLNLADEGFLWYGAWRTAAGDVPLRDFQAYDPGRYYWVAALSPLVGDGIHGLRAAVAAFWVVGLTLGLLAARRAVRSWVMLAGGGVILTLWLFPRWVFEPALAMAAVFFATRLLEQPTPGRHFAAGAFVGVAAFFGRNHALYALLSLMIIIAVQLRGASRDAVARRAASFAGGAALGAVPLLVMLVALPGFAAAYADSVGEVFRLGTTNLTLPVPWPWLENYAAMPALDALSRALYTSTFVVMPLSLAIGAFLLLRRRTPAPPPLALFLAAALVGIPYMHYAYSRADFIHLASAIHPWLLALIAAPALLAPRRRPWAAVAVAAFVVPLSLLTVARLSPLGAKLAAPADAYVARDVAGETLWLPRDEADFLARVEARQLAHLDPSQGVLVAPHLPGLYRILGRPSPVTEIYFLFAATAEQQRNMITDLEARNVTWAVLGNEPIDGMDERRLARTHDQFWRYLGDVFAPADDGALGRGYAVLRRVDAPPAAGRPGTALEQVATSR
jgi:hypothetical protein